MDFKKSEKEIIAAFEQFLKKSNIKPHKQTRNYVSVNTPIINFERDKKSAKDRYEKYMDLKHDRNPKLKFNYEINSFIKPKQYINNSLIQECVPTELIFIDHNTCRYDLSYDYDGKLDLHAHCIESARTKLLYCFDLAYKKNLASLDVITGQGPILKGAVELILKQLPFSRYIKSISYFKGKFSLVLKKK